MGRLEEEGVIGNLQELAHRFTNSGREGNIDIFDDVVASAEVGKKAPRAIGIIDRLGGVSMEESSVRWRMIRALSKAGMERDTGGVLTEIERRSRVIQRGDAWDRTCEQIAASLEQRSYKEFLDSKGQAITALEGVLKGKAVAGPIIQDVITWANKEETESGVIEQLAGMVSGDYFDKGNIKALAGKVVVLNSPQAGEYLKAMNELISGMSNLRFYGDNGVSLMARVLGREDSKELAVSLRRLMSVNTFNNYRDWSTDDDLSRWYRRQVLADIVKAEDPVAQVGRLEEEGVIGNLQELARRFSSESIRGNYIDIFDDVVASAEVGKKTTRAIKIIDRMNKISIDQTLMWKIIYALTHMKMEFASEVTTSKIVDMITRGGSLKEAMAKEILSRMGDVYDLMSSLDMFEGLDITVQEQSKLIDLMYSPAPVNKESFGFWRQLWEQHKSISARRRLLNILAHLVKEKKDFTFSYAFLKAQIDRILKVKINPGEERKFSPEEEAVIRAVNDTEQKEPLVPFLLYRGIAEEMRAGILNDLSGYVLDADIPSIYQLAKGNSRIGTERFWSLLYEGHQKFKVYPSAVMMEYLLKGGVTFEELEVLRLKVTGMTYPQLLKTFASEGKEDKLLLAYFLFHQPDINYGDHAFTFSLFKEVVEKALLFAKQDQTNQQAKEELRTAIRANAPRDAEEIIRAMDEGRVILPRSSGMVDGNGNFIPQEVNVTFEESTSMSNSRQSFVQAYNQQLMALVETLYMIQTIKGILARSSDEGIAQRLEVITASIQNTGDINAKLIILLRALHADALRLIPKFKTANEQELQKAASDEVNRFFIRFKKNALENNYGFQPLLKKYELKNLDQPFKEILPTDLDTLYETFNDMKNPPAEYADVSNFSGFAEKTMRLMWGSAEMLKLVDALPKEVLDGIFREQLGHLTSSAGSFSEEAQKSGWLKGTRRPEMLTLELLAKKDLVKFMRLADGAGCCISTNKKMELSGGYSRWMAAALNDDGLQAVLIRKNKKPIGFFVWYFANGENGTLEATTLRLYLKSEYHSQMVSDSMWRKVIPIFKALGVKRLGISDKTNGLGNTEIPNTFIRGSNPLKRFQTTTENTALFDISEYPANARGTMQQYAQDLAMISDTVSGISPLEVSDGDLEAALSTGKMIQQVSGQFWQENILRKFFDLGLNRETDFKRFINNINISINVMQPAQENLSTYGLAVETGKDGRDVYGASKWSNDASKMDIFISDYSWNHASDDVRREIIAHQLYKAYALTHRKQSSEDIDLEIKIDQELRGSSLWQNMMSAEEKEDLGLDENAPLLHLRARAFARLMGAPSELGAGSAYTDFLRLRREAGLKLKPVVSTFNKPDSFRMVQGGMETLVYIAHHREDPQDFIEEKLRDNQVLYWHYATHSGWVFRNIANVLTALVNKDKVQQIVLRVGKENQPVIDAYMNSGVDEGNRLKKLIETKIFPELLNDALKTPAIWMQFFDSIYQHNLMADHPVKLTAAQEYGQLPDSIFVEGQKTVVVQYYDRRTDAPRKQGVYHLVHVDPEVGFTNTQYNRLSYALNSALSSREDFGLDIKPEAPFIQDEIQMISSTQW